MIRPTGSVSVRSPEAKRPRSPVETSPAVLEVVEHRDGDEQVRRSCEGQTAGDGDLRTNCAIECRPIQIDPTMRSLMNALDHKRRKAYVKTPEAVGGALIRIAARDETR